MANKILENQQKISEQKLFFQKNISFLVQNLNFSMSHNEKSQIFKIFTTVVDDRFFLNFFQKIEPDLTHFREKI